MTFKRIHKIRICFCVCFFASEKRERPFLLFRRKDSFDHRGKTRDNHSMTYRSALRREVEEETDFDIDTLPDPDDVCEIPVGRTSLHQNYCIYMQSPLVCALPQDRYKGEIQFNGVINLEALDHVPGGYHGWAPLRWLSNRDDLMEPCKEVIRYLINYTDKARRTTSLPAMHEPATTTLANPGQGKSVTLVTAPACAVGTSSLRAGVPGQDQETTSSASLVSAQVCIEGTDGSESIRSMIRYATGFKQQKLHGPLQEKPFDVIRTHIGRLTKVRHVPAGSILKRIANTYISKIFRFRCLKFL